MRLSSPFRAAGRMGIAHSFLARLDTPHRTNQRDQYAGAKKY